MFLKPQNLINAVNIEPGMHVADYGCSRGDFAIQLSPLVGEEGLVYAVDVLKEPLSYLQGRIQSTGITNIKPIRANLEVDNPDQIPDQSINIIFLVNVLFQSTLHKEMIQEIVNDLKPNGKLIVADWKVFKANFGPEQGKEVNPDSIKQLCEIQGLKFIQNIDAGNYHWAMLFEKI